MRKFDTQVQYLKYKALKEVAKQAGEKTIVNAISGKCAVALDKTRSDTLVLAGGVAANSFIRRELASLCEKRGARFCVPSLALCGDNAAMVAAAGYFEYQRGNFSDTSLNASANDEL